MSLLAAPPRGSAAAVERTPLGRELANLDARVRALDHLGRLIDRAPALLDASPPPPPDDALAPHPDATSAELLAVADELALVEAAEIAWARVHAAASVPGGAAGAAASDDANAPERLRALAASLRGLVETPSTRSRGGRPERTRTNDPNEPERASPSSDPREAFAALETLADAREYARLVAPDAAGARVERNASDGFDAASEDVARRRMIAPRLAAGFGRWVVAHAALGTALRDPKAGVAPVEDEPEDESEFEAEFEAGEETGNRGARAGSNTRVEKDEEKNEPSRSPGGIEPEPEPPRRGGVSSASAVPSLIAPWARAAIGAASSAAEAARDASSGSSDPASRRAGALLFALAADRSERTARAVANWATHQPRLWPTRRAIGDLCVTLGELERIADAFDVAAGTFEAAAGAFKPVENIKAFLRAGDSAAAAEDSEDSAAAEDASADASAARVAVARARFAADRVRAALARLADAVVCATERVAADALEGLPALEKKKTERAADGPPGGFVPAAAAALRASAFLPLAAALRRVPPRVAHRVGPSAADAAVRALLARRASGAASGSAGAKKSKKSKTSASAEDSALAAEVEALAAAARETLGADAWGTTAWGASEAAAYASTLRRARAVAAGEEGAE